MFLFDRRDVHDVVWRRQLIGAIGIQRASVGVVKGVIRRFKFERFAPNTYSLITRLNPTIGPLYPDTYSS